ncbi:MAG: carboxylesterase/lipase family protein [Polyangiales bacterium]
MKRLALALCVALGSACGDDVPHDDEPLGPTLSSLHVRVRDGVLHGKSAGGVRAFLGVPYAKPPVGELRWRSPEPAARWQGEREATEYGPMCPQVPLSPVSEDCLSLNVWAPEPAASPRPVMVWLHGGAFAVGSNALYDGAPLAARGDVVLVAANYRLGALGFLAHPALTAEKQGRGSSGNYGIEDGVLALRWVKENIAAFGGDPNNVTLFGESAGSALTCVLLGTPAANGLVHRAIMESGACLGFESPLADAEARGEKTVQAIGCAGPDTLACLRGKDALELTVASTDLLATLLQQRWRPIIDGVLVPPIAAVNPVRLPIILGTNRDEGGAFGILAPTQSSFASRVEGYYPDPAHAKVVLDTYSAEQQGSWSGAFSALATDGLFVCPTRRLARRASAEVATYVYSFAHGEAHHADEVPYVFGLPGLDAEARRVSDQMMQAWTRFAKTGDPNGEGALTWPRYDARSDQHMVFDATPSIGTGLRGTTCDVLDTLPPLQFAN